MATVDCVVVYKVDRLRRSLLDFAKADQASALGLTSDGLGYLAMCRLPRPEHQDADIAQVSEASGVPAVTLQRLPAIRADEVDVYANLDCEGVRQRMRAIEAKYAGVAVP
jgi:hypothetical protein